MAPSLHFLSSKTSPSLCILSPYPSTRIYRSSLQFKVSSSSSSSSSQETIQIDTQQINSTTYNKKRRKRRPSFSDQIRDKWCLKPTSSREKFPWEEQQEQTHKREQQPIVEEQEVVVTESRIGSDSLVRDSLSFGIGNRIKVAPWVQERKPRKLEDGKVSQPHNGYGDSSDNFGGNDAIQVGFLEEKESFPVKIDQNVLVDEKVSKIKGGKIEDFENISGEFDSAKQPWRKDKVLSGGKMLETDEGKIQNFEGSMVKFHSTKQPWERGSKTDGGKLMNYERSTDNFDSNKQTWDRGNVLFNRKESKIDGRKTENFEGSSDGIDSTKLPWKREIGMKDLDGEEGFKKSNTMVAEKLIPETELKRLRNVALRMVERIQVKAAGITQALVDSIHEKWKIDEVVKLKFEGSFAMNMKRTHELLESRTGGLVIWRSGSSVVLFRGMAYKLHCVQQFDKQNEANKKVSSSVKTTEVGFSHIVDLDKPISYSESPTNYSARYLKDLSEEELVELNELNLLLEGLGPRFKDWCGRAPVPVDADLLPSVVHGFNVHLEVFLMG